MNGLHLLTDNQNLSADEYARLAVLLDELRAPHLESRPFVEAHGLNPDRFLPGNIWGAINQPDHFTNWTYDLANYVRCISPFTGFDLMMWGRRDVPGHLVPVYEGDLPAFDLVHNAISFNEMTTAQVAYYFDLVERHLAEDGVFHIAGGGRALDYHVDAAAMATDRFPNHRMYPERDIDGILVGERPNTFIRRSAAVS